MSNLTVPNDNNNTSIGTRFLNELGARKTELFVLQDTCLLQHLFEPYHFAQPLFADTKEQQTALYVVNFDNIGSLINIYKSNI